MQVMDGSWVNRRRLIGLTLVVLLALPVPAWADDSGGHDSGGHDGPGHDGPGHDNGKDNGGDNGVNGSDNGRNGSPASNLSNSGDVKHQDHGGDQGTARDAVSNGKAVSLREVLDAVDHSIGGEVIDVKLVNAQSGLRYDLKIIDRRGRLVEVSVNALTKEIRKVRGF